MTPLSFLFKDWFSKTSTPCRTIYHQNCSQDGRDQLLGCPTSLEFKWTSWHWCPRSKIYIWNPGKKISMSTSHRVKNKSISSMRGWAHVFLWTVELFSEQKIAPTSDLPQWQLDLLITFTDPGHSCGTTWLIFSLPPYLCRAEFSALCYVKQITLFKPRSYFEGVVWVHIEFIGYNANWSV